MGGFFFSFLSDRAECAESEEKAQAEYDKVYEGMKDVNEKIDAIAAKKKEKGKTHGKIHKWVFCCWSFLCVFEKQQWLGDGFLMLF